MTGTIIADNITVDCSGNPTSLGHNLDSDGTCDLTATGDLPNIDPFLGPLQDNGGLTETHALLPGSPAIDAIPAEDCNDPEGNPVTTDQRGIARPLGLACDIGAFESKKTFVVNTNDDIDDGICDSTHCSLREAIKAANANPGEDAIAFNIPGTGPHTIQPLSALPTITDPVIIDGYTQPGASPNTNGPGLGLNTVLKIELKGTNAGPPLAEPGVIGLHLEGGNSTVQGLVINLFSGGGIYMARKGGNLIKGNFIGTDVNGSADLGNNGDGVGLGFLSSNNVIGGTDAAARNVISGNRNGVDIFGSGATGNLIQGNFIGTDVTGTIGLGNLRGIWVSTALNTIGGTTPGAGNVISGNTRRSNFSRGIRIHGSAATSNVVQGNFIGTDVTGTRDLGNLLDGVLIADGASNNTIGGTAAGASNTIAFNGRDGVFAGRDGVFADSGSGNAILGNSIFSNIGLGIALSGDGVSPNDAGDGDTGPNNLQNFPVLSLAVLGNGSTTVKGTLNSAANTEFRIEFFSNTACDPSGYGEGEKFLGSTMVTTDASGDVGYKVTFPTTVPVGHFITATATDPDDNTSEFSLCEEVVDNTPPLLTLLAGITVEGDVTGGANKANTAIQSYLSAAKATDIVDPSPTIANDAPESFPVGTTVVTFTATDASGNQATAQATITVVDTTPPLITVPGGITVEGNLAGGADKGNSAIQGFLDVAEATDLVDPSPEVTSNAPDLFPVGDTVVTFTATDSTGNRSTRHATVTVVAPQRPTPTPTFTATPHPTSPILVTPGPTPTAITEPSPTPQPTSTPSSAPAGGGGCTAQAEGGRAEASWLLLGLVLPALALAGLRRRRS